MSFSSLVSSSEAKGELDARPWCWQWPLPSPAAVGTVKYDMGRKGERQVLALGAASGSNIINPSISLKTSVTLNSPKPERAQVTLTLPYQMPQSSVQDRQTDLRFILSFK